MTRQDELSSRLSEALSPIHLEVINESHMHNVPKGSETPFHRHHDEDEAFYVIEGRLTVFLEGGRTVVAKPGSYVHIPKGCAHGFRVEEALKMLVLSDPAGFVEFVVEAGMAAPRRELPPAGPPDFPKLERAAQKFRIDLLGPLPG